MVVVKEAKHSLNLMYTLDESHFQLKVPDGTFSWKWFKSLAQPSDLNLVGSTWSPK